jgi:hypothetical protein
MIAILRLGFFDFEFVGDIFSPGVLGVALNRRFLFLCLDRTAQSYNAISDLYLNELRDLFSACRKVCDVSVGFSLKQQLILIEYAAVKPGDPFHPCTIQPGYC